MGHLKLTLVGPMKNSPCEYATLWLLLDPMDAIWSRASILRLFESEGDPVLQALLSRWNAKRAIVYSVEPSASVEGELRRESPPTSLYQALTKELSTASFPDPSYRTGLIAFGGHLRVDEATMDWADRVIASVGVAGVRPILEDSGRNFEALFAINGLQSDDFLDVFIQINKDRYSVWQASFLAQLANWGIQIDILDEDRLRSHLVDRLH